MRIGILTITPNIGFGGIMQTFALKYFIEDLTHAEVFVINKKRNLSTKNRISFFFKSLYKLLFRHEFVKFTINGDYNYRSKNVRIFHDRYLNMTTEVHSSSELFKLINKNFDVVIVGSDQVWRPKYVQKINDYYLEGADAKIKKIAYAASFGVDNWEYNEKETKICRKLIKNFSYVSVREKSGIKLAEKHFGISPNYDLDPTLLLTVSAYTKLFNTNGITKKGYVFAYILDPSKDKTKTIELVSNILDKEVISFNTKAESKKSPLKESVAPPVEEWLISIYNSEYVVTDSFHGCVFSIIFNKPFMVYGNANRGIERFKSLFALLRLSNRLILNSSMVNEKVVMEAIDWSNINNFLKIERNNIKTRLKSFLFEHE